MYANKKHYVRNYEHTKDECRHTITIEWPYAKNIDISKIESIEETSMYWRKANAIHKWFVDNVQDWKDDCRTYEFDGDILDELSDIINKIINWSKIEDWKVIVNPELAHALLPTSRWFFFGGTEYDEYYIQTLQDTKVRIDWLKVDGTVQGNYTYRSSR